MAIVINNEHVARNIFKMRCQQVRDEIVFPEPGQFYMIRTWDREPLLSRPLSVFDYNPVAHTVDFLYRVVGLGTDKLCHVAASSDIQIDGPYGKGFPAVKGNITVVGGGIGIAPLYYMVKDHRQNNPDCQISAFLGFTQLPYAVDYFNNYCNSVYTQIGGAIADTVAVHPGESVFACGPEAMLVDLCTKIPETNPVYLSLEGRMACGLGACFGCVRQIPIVYKRQKGRNGRHELINVANRQMKICTDGPVFRREVI